MHWQQPDALLSGDKIKHRLHQLQSPAFAGTLCLLLVLSRLLLLCLSCLVLMAVVSRFAIVLRRWGRVFQVQKTRVAFCRSFTFRRTCALGVCVCGICMISGSPGTALGACKFSVKCDIVITKRQNFLISDRKKRAIPARPYFGLTT